MNISSRQEPWLNREQWTRSQSWQTHFTVAKRVGQQENSYKFMCHASYLCKRFYVRKKPSSSSHLRIFTLHFELRDICKHDSDMDVTMEILVTFQHDFMKSLEFKATLFFFSPIKLVAKYIFWLIYLLSLLPLHAWHWTTVYNFVWVSLL